jgi:glycosyltransferase involved in cell wall biosynthesis
VDGLAYLFERFPSYTQTFCFREVAELRRQGHSPVIFSVRQSANEPIRDREMTFPEVSYLPAEAELVREVDRSARKRLLPEAVVREVAAWGRKTDFLRLYQAAWLGPRLQEQGIKHVHAHFAGLAARTAYWIDHFFGIGFSFTAHANDIFAPKPFEISLGKLFAAARAVVTVSDFAVEYLRRKFPEESSRIHRVYNGIDVERFRLSDVSARPPVLISVGRLIEKKGFADLIEAGRLLHQRGIGFRVEIIGEGPQEPTLRAQIGKAGLGDLVQLTGALAQDEVRARLGRSTIFVLPCVTEKEGGMDNLPTVIMEAMAAGLPVVSTAIAGVPEMVQNRVTGILLSEHDPKQLAETLAALLADETHLRSLGRAGRERAAELFAIEKNVDRLRELFSKLVESGN